MDFTNSFPFLLIGSLFYFIGALMLIIFGNTIYGAFGLVLAISHLVVAISTYKKSKRDKKDE